jgi:hypothetical protein
MDATAPPVRQMISTISAVYEVRQAYISQRVGDRLDDGISAYIRVQKKLMSFLKRTKIF